MKCPIRVSAEIFFILAKWFSSLSDDDQARFLIEVLKECENWDGGIEDIRLITKIMTNAFEMGPTNV
jgi:hypothetical protein